MLFVYAVPLCGSAMKDTISNSWPDFKFSFPTTVPSLAVSALHTQVQIRRLMTMFYQILDRIFGLEIQLLT